ncbi:hypothetical protein BD410DRAFT_780026 [Rickenella mellea]|uniref:Uncharacterized protein n=1 Tax=Rickenella mellea TaxID=50990 RepID=A0A4R5XG31_9AGAM|nr:hypothetical protein BD410DRAFT_780026 [Rickenella mellea]
MRRIVSVLSNKRDKSDAASSTSNTPLTITVPKSRSRLFSKAPATPISTLSPAPASPGLITASSSSSASSSLRTPEDDATTASPITGKRRWPSWLASRSLTHSRPALHGHDAQIRGSEGLRRFTNPDASSPLPAQRQDVSDSDDSDSSDESEEDNSPAVLRNASNLDPTVVSKSQTNFRTLTRNALTPPINAPPLVDLPFSPLFPRSANTVQSLRSPQTTESLMHRKALLRRLECKKLSAHEQASLLRLASRPMPTSTQPPFRKTDEDAIAPDVMKVRLLSRGLRKWVARPCFEERAVVWTEDGNGTVVCKAVEVSRRGLAVAELEFSESMDILSGWGLNEKEFEESLHASSKACASRPPPPKSTRPRVTFQSVPSPLRIEHRPNRSMSSPLDEGEAKAGTKGVSTARGVRFADDEDGKEDNIPLGYALQAKRKQEQKEKFLRVEHERRMREEEKRRARDAMQKRLEEEQRAREEDRRLREERQRIKYADEIVAARLRREKQRTGSDNSHSEDIYLRRTSSHSRNDSPGTSGGSRPSSFSDSPGGSRRSSYVQSGHSSHGSSSEDVRSQQKHRRQSVTSERSDQQFLFVPLDQTMRNTLPRSLSNPPSGPMYAAYPLIAVPPVPVVPWDMPLLPPTPAFMMQQYPVRSSNSAPNSRDPSPSTRSANLRPKRSKETMTSRHSSSGNSARPQPTRASTMDSPAREPVAQWRDTATDKRTSRSQHPPPSFSPNYKGFSGHQTSHTVVDHRHRTQSH